MSEEMEEPQSDFAVPENEELFAAEIEDEENNNATEVEAVKEVASQPELVEIESEETEADNENEIKPESEPIALETAEEGGALPSEQGVVNEEAPAPAEPQEQIDEQKPDEQQQGEPEFPPSEFRLRLTSDNFLEPEVDPDIPSQVSQLTMVSEFGTSTQEKSKHQEPPLYLRKHEDDPNRISGDFTVATTSIRMSTQVSLDTYLTEIESASVESFAEVEEQPEPILDRELYYEMHDNLEAEIAVLKISNNFFHKKMTEYFKKRKMEHVLKETDQQVDTQKKYFKRLDTLWELLQVDETRRAIINGELHELIKERDEKLDFINTTMKQLLEREIDISSRMKDSKTGKEISSIISERLIKRQICAVEQIAEQRLKYIKIRNRVTEKQKAIQAVEKLGEGLRLVDFEQLKIEYRGYADKLEEREDELTKLRAKCDSIFQMLAHLREKSAAATLDTIKEQQELRTVELEHIEARERSNYFKVERDRYRAMINKLREESGILFKSKMLQDMEHALHETEITKTFLKKIREQQKTQLGKLRAIRKNMEIVGNYRALQDKSAVSSKGSVVYKGQSRSKVKK